MFNNKKCSNYRSIQLKRWRKSTYEGQINFQAVIFIGVQKLEKITLVDSGSERLDGCLFMHLHSMFIHSSDVSQAHIRASSVTGLRECQDEQHKAHGLKELAGW